MAEVLFSDNTGEDIRERGPSVLETKAVFALVLGVLRIVPLEPQPAHRATTQSKCPSVELQARHSVLERLVSSALVR